MKILNLTQHKSTPDQNCIDLEGDSLANLKKLLTFNELPNHEEIEARANDIALLASLEGQGEIRAMIGGAPFFMSALESALLDHGIQPVYAFSKREVLEEKQDDGAVVKKNVFKHLGFVEVQYMEGCE